MPLHGMENNTTIEHPNPREIAKPTTSNGGGDETLDQEAWRIFSKFKNKVPFETIRKLLIHIGSKGTRLDG